MPTTTERVTVTLPTELVDHIDRFERNRSRFVAEAVRNELARRRRDELRRSLVHPHPDTIEHAELGLDAWGEAIAESDALVDPSSGVAVTWDAAEGWRKETP